MEMYAVLMGRQVSCLAVEFGVYGCVFRSLDLLVVECAVLDTVCWRSGAYCVARVSRVQRWYVHPVLSQGDLTDVVAVAADTLDRFELPFFGPLASRFVDQE